MEFLKNAGGLVYSQAASSSGLVPDGAPTLFQSVRLPLCFI
jgi:hypothetical protein